MSPKERRKNMAIENHWKQRMIGGLIVGLVLLIGIGLCMSSCQLVNALKEESGGEQSSVEKDSYETKILYYETQVKYLTSQLDQIEQQLYLLRSDYMDQMKQLEEQLNQQRPTVPEFSEDFEQDNTSPPKQENNDSVNQDTSTSVPPDITTNDYTYYLENGCAILTAYLGKEKEVIVPAAVDGYLVVGIGDNAFAGCDIISVILPQTVETIGWFSFYQCERLNKILLPAKISNIGYASFDGCSAKLCLYVEEDSYAERYAISFGLNYQNQT